MTMKMPRSRMTGRLVSFGIGLLALIALAGLPIGAARAAASLTIEPLTWSVLGLDGEDVEEGPNEYPVGVRVCNDGDAASGELTATFAFDGGSDRISLANASPTQTFPALEPDDCVDIYYVVRVARASASYGSTADYLITVSDGSQSISTGQELIVKAMEMTDENYNEEYDGPEEVTVGQQVTYNVTLTSPDAGYAEAMYYLTFCPDIFRLDGVEVSLSQPGGGQLDRPWADGCAWDTAGNSGCTGAATAYGGTIDYRFTMTVIGTGECELSSVYIGYTPDTYYYNDDYFIEYLDIVSEAGGGTGGPAPQSPSGQVTATPRPTATPSPTATPQSGGGAAAATATPEAEPTAQPETLPATGSRARPAAAVLAAAVPSGPLQGIFNIAVIFTLLLGAALIVWSVLLVAGALRRESALTMGVWRTLSVVFVVCALALAGVLGYGLVRASLAARSPEPAAQAPASGGAPPVFLPPEIPATQLIIPELGIDTGLTEAPRSGGSWDVSLFTDEIAHLEGTAYPGTTGNAVLAGHVHHTQGVGPFYRLRELQPGHLILARGEGIEYRYQVEWVKVVTPAEVEFIAPAAEPVLTLISCANWDSASWSYTDRVVVRAKFFDRARLEG